MTKLTGLERQEAKGNKKTYRNNKYTYIISAKDNGGSRFSEGIPVDFADTVKEITQSKYSDINDKSAIYTAFKKVKNNIISISENYLCERVRMEA